MKPRLLATMTLLMTTAGCSSLKNTWNYTTTTVQPTARAAPAGFAETRRKCKTPLRVAVSPFSEDKRIFGDYGVGGSIGATFAGLVMAPPLGIVKEESLSYDQMSWTTMYGIALYAELVDSGCFASVTWRPKDTSSYDLIFDGSLRRFGNQKRMPFVPLPIFLGTALSLSFVSITFLNEWDIVAKRPDGQDVFMFGAEAACNGTECIDWKDLSASRDLREQLRRGYSDFIDQLYSYVASREPAYWEEVHRRTKERYFHRTDQGLAMLEAARAGLTGSARDALDEEIRKRRDLLESLWRIDVLTEDAWANNSASRVLAEVNEANQKADEEYRANLKKAVVMAATGAVTLGSQIQSGQIKPTFMMEVNAKTDAYMKDVEKIEKWIDLVRSIFNLKDRPSSDLLAEILLVLEKQDGGTVAKRLASARTRYTELVGTSAQVLARIKGK